MAGVKTIAMINQKGGVGKTTSAANLGAGLARRGLDVFLVDLDPQAHLSLYFGMEADPRTPTVYDVLTGQRSISEVAMMLDKHLCLLPANVDLAATESEMSDTAGREHLLRNALASHSLPCDFTIIDCPPALGLLTLNALSAADEVVIPLQPQFLALQGLGKLLETVALVRQHINPSLHVCGIVLCMYESLTRLTGEVEDDLRHFLQAERQSGKPWSDARLFNARIRRNIKLAECPSYGQSIFDYDPRCHGAEDYSQLVDEFIQLFLPDRVGELIETPDDKKDAASPPPTTERNEPINDADPAAPPAGPQPGDVYPPPNVRPPRQDYPADEQESPDAPPGGG